ncbi:MAG: hypothetical protein CMJ78_22405 [Planctomycetaceae bacterium]|nr:hypothetical protein [Planctomycetaceae bacterium]
MEASKQHDHQMQRLFRTWQDRWASQSDELEQRLEYIDEQLSKLSDDEDVATIPHLSIVR